MSLQKKIWEPSFYALLKFDRPITDIEYEAIMDLMHGLPVSATFRSGGTSTLHGNRDTLLNLKKLLRADSIVEVTYLPESLKILAGVLKEACKTLQRVNCDSYDQYPGLISTASRPLTGREEQVIKWATLHGLPPDHLVQVLKGMPPSERKKGVQKGLEMRSLTATGLIESFFAKPDSDRLLKLYTLPYLQAAFERLDNLINGIKVQ